jgi:integrase/recombinase XerD
MLELGSNRQLEVVMLVPHPDADRAPLTEVTADAHLIQLWLHGRSPHTQRAYQADIHEFLLFTRKPLRACEVADVIAYADALAQRGLTTGTQARHLGSVKAFFSWGHRFGYVPYDIGKAVVAPPHRRALAERILSEGDVLRLCDREPNPRNRVLLRLLYDSALRVHELCSLKWRDLQPRPGGAGQVSVWGKGARERAVWLVPAMWQELMALGPGAPEAPVFRSRQGGPLRERQVLNIVRRAAQRAGIAAAVSPHWLRHAHASHALDRGAPVSLVSATLGHADLRTTSVYTHARPDDSSGRYLPR